MNLIKKAKKSLGQNFLIDQNIVKKIINIGNINENKTVLEIGPGYGSLTKKIVSMNPNTIFAIEKDKKLSVAPLTTHITLGQVSKKINKLKIIKKVKIINNFYKKIFNKNPNIGVLGLNPHNFSSTKKSEEKEIIFPAIKIIKKSRIKVMGPVSPDTSFMLFKRYKLDVILGMYHDQVLSPFKALFEYDAINITLGLPYFRISPDHGVAENIIGKNIANPKSLIESIKFFNYIK